MMSPFPRLFLPKFVTSHANLAHGLPEHWRDTVPAEATPPQTPVPFTHLPLTGQDVGEPHRHPRGRDRERQGRGCTWNVGG